MPRVIRELLLGAVCISLMAESIASAATANDALQEILDRQHSWIAKIDSLQATVTSDFRFGPDNDHSVATGTIYIEGEKFRVDSTARSPGKGGSVDMRPLTLFWDGATYLVINSASDTAQTGTLPSTPDYHHNPYGAFKLPFLEYSWVTTGNGGQNSLVGLKDPAVWQANNLPVKTIRDQQTSAGLQRTVTFQWDHGAELPYIVENDMVFSEPHNFMAIGYTTRFIYKQTSAARTVSIGTFDEWTTVSMGSGKGSIALPMQYHAASLDNEGALIQETTLRADAGTVKINKGINPAVFTAPVIPSSYRVSDVQTGELLTTDTEVLRTWNERFTLRSCLECAETTNAENLSSGNLSVELQLTGANDQSLQGRPFKVFYRYANCCVLYKEGVLDNDALIRLEQIPGKLEEFEYPVYVDNVLVTTLQPEESEKLTVQVAPLRSQSAPDISLTDMFTSETTALSAFSGKRIILDFWGIDCAPCRPALVKLSKLASAASTSSTVFMAVTTRFGRPDRTMDFINENQLTSIRHFWVPNTAFEYVGNDGIPLTVLIDENGEIVWRGNPGDPDFEKIVSSFIGN